MRNIIYITGIGATGKTSIASSMSKKFNIPILCVDDIYVLLHEEMSKKYTELKKMHWGELTLKENQKKYTDIKKYKELHYSNVLKGISGDLIIEGFQLMYEEDRLIIEKELGPHNSTFFVLELSFEKWFEVSSHKYKSEPTYEVYKSHMYYLEAPKSYLVIKDNKYQLAIDRVEYQKDDFIKAKWNALKIDDLKGQTVLDCGCNDGWIGKFCLDKGAESVLGLDNNWRYLKEANDKGLLTELFDLNNMQDMSSSFDVVLCLAVWHHLNNRELFFKEISRITKKMFVLEVPIWKNEEIAIKYRKDQDVFVPTTSYVLYWLGKYFKRVEIVGESVSPGDKSYRLIFKAYK